MRVVDEVTFTCVCRLLAHLRVAQLLFPYLPYHSEAVDTFVMFLHRYSASCEVLHPECVVVMIGWRDDEREKDWREERKNEKKKMKSYKKKEFTSQHKPFHLYLSHGRVC